MSGRHEDQRSKIDTDARLRRCGHEHEGWAVLGEHLCADFPAVPRQHVLRALAEGRGATKLFQLGLRDELDTVELIVRNRLIALTCDPADHTRPRRMRSPIDSLG